MKKVFICSALHGDIQENIEKANEYCRWAMLRFSHIQENRIRIGALPIAPHVYFTQFLDDDSPAERELGINAGIELLTGCDALWYFGDHITEGMSREIRMANSLGIPVSHIDSEEISLTETNENLVL